MSDTNFVRIPSISADLFEKSDVNSLTEGYFHESMTYLTSAHELVNALEAQHMDEVDKICAIQEMVEAFDDEDYLKFFNDQNLARYTLETMTNTGKKSGEMIEILNKSFPILYVVDGDYEVMEERIDRRVNRVYNEMYPLYCEPKEETIRHFIEYCPDIAFCEVGDGNFFAYLTSNGQTMSVEIAYAYLKVDGCIPNNILNKAQSYSHCNDVIYKEINEFFSNEN